MFVALALFYWIPPIDPDLFLPVHRHVALESQKLMLFEYGQSFKLHRRSRSELYQATLKHADAAESHKTFTAHK